MYFLLQLVVLLRMIVCVYFDVDANFVCNAYVVVVVVFNQTFDASKFLDIKYHVFCITICVKS